MALAHDEIVGLMQQKLRTLEDRVAILEERLACLQADKDLKAPARQHRKSQVDTTTLRSDPMQLDNNKSPETMGPQSPKATSDGHYPALAFIDAVLARKLLNRRLEAGLTQEELAAKARVRQETISRLESGKHSPNLRTLKRIIQAFERMGR